MTTDPNAAASELLQIQLRELDAKVAPVRWAALAMFFVYGASIISVLFPLQLREPLWHQNAINSLVNNGVIPLVGLSLLQLLRLIHPDLRPTRELLKSASRWALPAALGFLLLVPLQVGVAISVLNQADSNDLGQSQQARQQIARLRAAIQAAGSSHELAQAVPGLPPQVADQLADQLADQPLAEARQQLLTNLDREEGRIQPRLNSAKTKRRWAVARDAFRNIVACLALAAAFFALRLRRSAI